MLINDMYDVVVFVAGISPLLQERNGSLSSIGWKGRLLYENAENKWTESKKEQKDKKRPEAPLQTMLGLDSSYLQTTIRNNKPEKQVKKQTCKQIWVRKQLSY